LADIFKFKQFDVSQSGCAMKVNTDGVLLGALANFTEPKNILDIGAGTGVIALMLVQRFINADIDAVEIDEAAAKTAKENFRVSKFTDRLAIFASGFEEYFNTNAEKRYDLIVSNPPFFLNSLASPGAKTNLAKHTNETFFEKFVSGVAKHLTDGGLCAMILPLTTANFVKVLLAEVGLYLQAVISIKSFAESAPHREIITFGRQQVLVDEIDVAIYDEPKIYSAGYQQILKEFLTIF
jgi:tRNA1Val (adenine37-N6)-methyltransferase